MIDLIRWFSAQYPGVCSACTASFSEGEDVGYLNDELVGFACCGGVGDFKSSDSSIIACPKCFMIHGLLQKECE